MEAIISYFENLDPIVGALYATLFTWGLTAFGASLVFFYLCGVHLFLLHFRWSITDAHFDTFLANLMSSHVFLVRSNIL